MYFVKLNIVLATCFCVTNGLSFNVFNYLLNEINELAATLDSTTIFTKWMMQPLDHFNATDKRTWRMRYLQRLDKWRIKGPVFIFINGEGPAGKGFLQTGTMFELAVETKGAMFLSEHRYYGQSKPFKDFTPENLQYLSSRQALADIANLIVNIKSNVLFRSSKVVVVGGSYAGNLAAWMKLLYPELVNAAIASSGPVLAKANFHEYIDQVSNDFQEYGTSTCYDKIAEIFQRYDKMFKTDAGIQQLKEEEQICDETDMTKWENRELFFLDKVSDFMSIAQYGDTDDVKDQCVSLANTNRISSKTEEDDMWNGKSQCHDYEFDSFIESIKSIDSYMAWIYQTCTEFGYYQTTAPENQPFTENIGLRFYYKMCTATFGPNFDGKRVEDGVERSNKMYGGLTPNVTNVVFVNGDLDPWHRLGVLEDISYDAPAKRIPRSSHCRDLFSDRQGDPEELKEARIYIKYLIKKWIGAGEFNNPK